MPSRAEIGDIGLPLFAGSLQLDPNKQLRGAQGVRTFREMAFDEPAATAFLGAANQLLRTDIAVEPGGSKRADKLAAAFLTSCLDDMRDSVATSIRQMYSMIWAGWDIHELVYKRRPTDGRIGWAAWALRRQETLYRWNTDPNGRITEFAQRPAPSFSERRIPLTKAVHIVADDSEGSPEGKSAIRGMYRQWYFVRNLELLMGITLERFGTGIPVFEIEPGAPGLTPDDKREIETIAASLRQNEEAYVLLPPGIRFRFAASPGLDSADYRETIQMMRVWMLATALADFIALGTGSTGSFALGQDKSELFLLALNGYQERVLAALNRQAVPWLFTYNSDFGKLTDLPRLTLPAVRRYDLAALGAFAQVLQRIGAFHVTPEDEAHFRRISDLVDVDAHELRRLHDADKEAAAATPDEPPTPDLAVSAEGDDTPPAVVDAEQTTEDA